MRPDCDASPTACNAVRHWMDALGPSRPSPRPSPRPARNGAHPNHNQSNAVASADNAVPATPACPWRHGARPQARPVEPKPPLPRPLASNDSTSRKRACTIGTTTSWAMRSNGSIVNAAALRFQQLTISGPW